MEKKKTTAKPRAKAPASADPTGFYTPETVGKTLGTMGARMSEIASMVDDLGDRVGEIEIDRCARAADTGDAAATNAITRDALSKLIRVLVREELQAARLRNPVAR